VLLLHCRHGLCLTLPYLLPLPFLLLLLLALFLLVWCARSS
jgi:hypothetical protein